MTDTISDEVIQEILALDEQFRHYTIRYANYPPDAAWEDALDSILNGPERETGVMFAHARSYLLYKIPVAAAIIRQQQERIKELEKDAKIDEVEIDILREEIAKYRKICGDEE